MDEEIKKDILYYLIRFSHKVFYLIEQIIQKLLSGRFILTVIGGIVFYKVTQTKMLPDSTVATILTAIFLSYFSKKRNDKNPSI